jgi:hypothetical protein
MTIYTPIESPHRVDARCTVFKTFSCDLERFCVEKQKRVQKRVQKSTFSSTKSTSSAPSTVKNLYSQKIKNVLFFE